MSHCEGCVMCEADGVPIEAATWLDWAWLKGKPLPIPRGRERTARMRPVRVASERPAVVVMSNGRRHRIRRGNPPARPAIDTVGGESVGTGFLHMGVTDRKSTRGGVKGAKGTPR